MFSSFTCKIYRQDHKSFTKRKLSFTLKLSISFSTGNSRPYPVYTIPHCCDLRYILYNYVYIVYMCVMVAHRLRASALNWAWFHYSLSLTAYVEVATSKYSKDCNVNPDIDFMSSKIFASCWHKFPVSSLLFHLISTKADKVLLTLCHW